MTTVSGSGTGTYEMTRDWVFRKGALNRPGLSDRGGVQSCSTGQYDKTDVF